MKKSFLIFFIFAIFCGFTDANAQSLQLLKPVNMGKWGVPAGDYSGICYLGNDRYAVVSDKQEKDGWYEFEIQLNEETAKIEALRVIAFHSNDNNPRDAEDICYVKSSGKIYIAAENDQRIIEYDSLGNRTGKEMDVPEIFSADKIFNNYGFESLTYSDETGLFWTCTENTLKKDYKYSSEKLNVEANIRLQAFEKDLKPLKAKDETYYVTDKPTLKHEPRAYAFGVPALTALDDGSLLVLEREFFVARKYLGSYVINKLFRVPSEALDRLNSNADTGSAVYGLSKLYLGGWKTSISLTRRNIANYEGMCLGPKLKDGRQTILFISDSQGGYGNSVFHLKDYLRVGILTY